MKLTRYLLPLAGLVLTLTGARSAGKSPDELLKVYPAEGEKLIAHYERLHLVAQVEEDAVGKKGVYELEQFQDGKKIKVVRRFVSGEHILKADTIVYVACPSQSFVLRRAPEAQDYVLGLRSTSAEDYERTQYRIDIGYRILRSHYSCLQVPLTKFLTMKETTVTGVTEVKGEDGRPLQRVTLRILPFSDGMREQCSHLDGWLLFDPAAHWALVAKEINQLGKEKEQLLFKGTGSFTYGEPVDGFPTLRTAREDMETAKGDFARRYRADVKTVEFGAVPEEVFTLEGSGFRDYNPGPARRLTHFFWIFAGTAVLALTLIFLLRRWRPKARAPQGGGAPV